MNKKKMGIILGVIVVLAVVATSGMGRDKGEDTAVTAEEESAVAVTTVLPVEGTLKETIFTIGEVEPSATYSVMAKASGTVEATYFEVGDTVAKDDILFKIDTDSFNVSKQSTLTQLNNAVKQTKQNLDQTQENYDKQKQLYDQGAISESVFTNVETALDSAKIAYENALASYQSSANQLEDQYDAYVQKSPVGGVIVSKGISTGQFVASQVAYTIIPDTDFIIAGSVTSKYINAIKRGLSAQIYVNTLEKSYQGEVTNVGSVAMNGSYPIELSLEGDEALRAGLYAEVDIIINQHENVMLLPRQAVKQDYASYFVYVVSEEGTAKKQAVTLGLSDEDHYEILSGLSYTDPVIHLGLDYVEEGTAVVISQE